MFDFSSRGFFFPIITCFVPPTVFFDIERSTTVGKPVLNHWMEPKRCNGCPPHNNRYSPFYFNLVLFERSRKVRDVFDAGYMIVPNWLWPLVNIFYFEEVNWL
jgi:hypothetical protein